MDKFLDRFSNFFVRSVAPSLIFFVLLFFNDMYFNESKIKDAVINITKAEDKKETSKEISLNIKDLKISDDKEQIVITIDKPTISSDVKKTEKDKLKDTDAKSDANPNINLIYIFMAFIFMAYGYVNQILTQILDNSIKENYDDSDDKYTNLRDKVKMKFTIEFNDWKEDGVIILNDYNLYQILSRDKSIAPNSNYVDEVKTIQTLLIAIILNLFFINIFTILINIILILILIFSKKVQHFINIPAKSRYKARNKRLYINYLLKEDKKEKCEKEIKIKSIKVEVDE